MSKDEIKSSGLNSYLKDAINELKAMNSGAKEAIETTQWLKAKGDKASVREARKDMQEEADKEPITIPAEVGDVDTDELKKKTQKAENDVEPIEVDIKVKREARDKAIRSLKEFIDLAKSLKKINLNIFPKEGQIQSSLVNKDDITKKGDVSQKSVRKALNTYLESNTKKNLDVLSAYVNGLHDIERAESIFGDEHADIFQTVKNHIEEANQALKAFQDSENAFEDAKGILTDMFGLGDMNKGQIKDFKNILLNSGVEDALNYLKEQLGFEIPNLAPKAFIKTNEVVKKTTDIAISKTDELSEKLKKENEELKRIESSMNIVTSKKENAYEEVMKSRGYDPFSTTAIYDSDKIFNASKIVETFQSELVSRKEFDSKYDALIEIVKKYFIGDYGISSNMRGNTLEEFIQHSGFRELAKLRENGIKGVPTKQLNEMFRVAIGNLQSDVEEVRTSNTIKFPIVKEIEEYKAEMSRKFQEFYDEYQRKSSEISKLHEEWMQSLMTTGGTADIGKAQENIQEEIEFTIDDLRKMKRTFDEIYEEESNSLKFSNKIGVSWAEDEIGSLDRIAERLRELYSIRNKEDFEKQYGNEVVALLDVAAGAGYGDFVTEDGVNHLSKTIQAYFKNIHRFVEARKLLEEYSNRKTELENDPNIIDAEGVVIEDVTDNLHDEQRAIEDTSAVRDEEQQEVKETTNVLEEETSALKENEEAQEQDAEAIKKRRKALKQSVDDRISGKSGVWNNAPENAQEDFEAIIAELKELGESEKVIGNYTEKFNKWKESVGLVTEEIKEENQVEEQSVDVQNQNQQESQETVQSKEKEVEARKENEEAIRKESEALKEQGGIYLKERTGENHVSITERTGSHETTTTNARWDNKKGTWIPTSSTEVDYKALEADIIKRTKEYLKAKAELNELIARGAPTSNLSEELKEQEKTLYALNKELDDYYDNPKYIAGEEQRADFAKRRAEAVKQTQRLIAQEKELKEFNEAEQHNRRQANEDAKQYQKLEQQRLKENQKATQEAEKIKSQEAKKIRDAVDKAEHDQAVSDSQQYMKIQEQEHKENIRRLKEIAKYKAKDQADRKKLDAEVKKEAEDYSANHYKEYEEVVKQINDIKKKNLSLNEQDIEDQVQLIANNKELNALSEKFGRIHKEINDNGAYNPEREEKLVKLQKQLNDELVQEQQKVAGKNASTLLKDIPDLLDKIKKVQEGDYDKAFQDSFDKPKKDLLDIQKALQNMDPGALDADRIKNLVGIVDNLKTSITESLDYKSLFKDTISDTKRGNEAFALGEYEAQLKELGLLSDDVKERIGELAKRLSNATNPDSMRRYTEEFTAFKNSMKTSVDLAKALKKEEQADQDKAQKAIQDSINAAYKEQSDNLKLIYKYKEENISLDDKSWKDSSKLATNLQKIATLEERNLELKEQLGIASSVNVDKEQELVDLEAKLSSELSDKQRSFFSSEIDDIVDGVEKYISDVNKIRGDNKFTEEYQRSFDDAFQSLQKMKEELSEIDLDKLDADYVNELKESFDRLAESIDKSLGQKGLASNKAPAQSSLEKLRKSIEDIEAKNTAMGRDFRERFENLKLQIDTAKSNEDVEKLKASIVALEAELIASGETGKSAFQKLREAVGTANTQFIQRFFSLQDLVRYGREAFDTIKEIDYALVDLKKTSTMTGDELNQFYYEANNVAKAMGVSTTAIIEQASAWSRLGYSSKEASTEMAQLSSQFASISPGMSTETAQTGLVSLMKAYDIATDEVERKLMDNINILGKKSCPNS